MQTIENFTTPVAAYFEQGFNCGFKGGYNQGIKDSNASVLTKPEIDVLVDVLSKRLSMLDHMISHSKFTMNYFYVKCNPDDISTLYYYERYKDARYSLKYFKKQRNKLAVIQSKLKKLRSCGA